MKIRTKLTLFFTLVFLGLFVVFFVFLFGSFRFRMTGILENRMDRMTEDIIKKNKLNEAGSYVELKKINLNFRVFKRAPPPPESEKEDIKFAPFFWITIFDEKLNILNQTDYAKSFNIKIKESDLKKRFFIVNFKNIESDNLFTTNVDDIGYGIAKAYKLKTQDVSDFYIVTLHPFTEENEYLIELERIIFALTIVVVLIIFIIGILYSKYSLSPINKIVKQLNDITNYDLSKRVITKNNKDEIGELTSSVNNLLSRIEKAFLMEKQFVSDVSHEFKTPIASLRLSIEELINNEKLSDDSLDKLGHNLEVLYSLDFLVKKLLYMSKLEQGIIAFKPQKFVLKETLDKIISNLQLIAQNKNLKINCFIDDGCEINGDKELLYIALYNIVENALKYTEKGFVNITATNGENKIIISIEDTGSGIPARDIDKIFDKFYRTDKSRKENEGYGIGLTISKRIIDIHEGKIAVESREKYGTIFNIEIKKIQY